MILTLLLSVGGPLGWGLLGAWAQVPSTRFSDPHSPRPPGVWRAEAEDRDPVRRNWCPYQKSRLVTFVAACKTEKFLVHSQQPCPHGAPDCQKVKVMYRVAHKPVYQVKQKVLASMAWRCCPGFVGPDCQHHDPRAIPEPEDPGDSLQEPWDGPVDFEPGMLLSGPDANRLEKAVIYLSGNIFILVVGIQYLLNIPLSIRKSDWSGQVVR